MESKRNILQQEMDLLFDGKNKPHGLRDSFLCHDCRSYHHNSEMAKIKKSDVAGYCRCKKCYRERQQRVAEHAKRIRKEMARRKV